MNTSVNPYDLSGRVALITGGAGLLGTQFASALLASNAHVILADVNDAALQAAQAKLCEQGDYTSQIELAKLDITKTEKVAAFAKDLEARGRFVQILLNNAAINPKVDKNAGMKEASRFEHFSLEQWNLEISVGLTGAMICSQVFGAIMAEKRGGVILNIASDLSVIAPDQRLYRKEGLSPEQQPVKPVTYSVIKTGLVGLTRYLAGYWAEKNIRVNALSPGGVYTDQPEVFTKRLEQLIPMGRMARANEYNATIQFLCSDASSYLTGQNIVVDGGRSVL